MKTLLTCTLLALATVALSAQQPDLLIADFEGADYGNWKVTGQAFGPGPAQGTLPGQMHVDGFLGRGLVNSFYQGDGTTGTLSSPPFKIERKYIRFLIGGGQHPGQACVNLLLDGKVVRTATGPNDRPGGSERLDWGQWDAADLAGQTVTLQIVDQATGGWGHINLDQIIQTDRTMPRQLTDVTRTITVEKRYLNLPVKNGAPKRWVTLLVEDRIARDFEIELADADPDWWAFLDLTPFRGRRAIIKVDKLREDSAALKSIEQSDAIKGGENLYREPLRPQFHFSSRRGWNNDPNGLVYYDGEYHLFYQHNPFGWNWGNMHWGHAVSPDLVRWQELDDALHPDPMGTMFSGSAAVDLANTTGFEQGNDKPIICVYTAAGGTSRQSQGQPFTQCIAYSTDRGRTWAKYAKNPVLPHIVGSNRDPKVLWYAPGKKWVMALYLDRNEFALFDSPDLKQWHRLCTVEIPGAGECPEFFEIALDGQADNTRWILYGGNGLHLIGRFDGRTFTKESGPHPLNFGNCFYASQTFNNIPAADGRRILMPWGQVAMPGMPFNQMIGLPVELTLRTTDDGLRLFAYPVREFTTLRARKHSLPPQTLSPGQNPLAQVNAELADISAQLAPGDASEIGFNLRGVAVSYDVRKQGLSCRDRKAALKLVDGHIRLRLLLDRTSVDIFGNDGRLYMPMGAIPAPENRSLEIYAKGGSAQIQTLDVHELKSAWTQP